MFEYFNNQLCVEARWLIDEGIMTKSNYDMLRHRGLIDVVRRACLNTPALVAYESLPERFKKKIKAKVGDPYKLVHKGKLRSLIAPDATARKYYREYIMDNGEHLPETAQVEYRTNAEILNAIHKIVVDKPTRARIIGKSTGLWPAIAKAVLNLDKTAFKHTLPDNYRRLQERYRKYKAKDNSKYDRIGYESLIHGNWCNKNSEKINDEAKVWVLSRWTSMVDRIATTEQLHAEYNQLAESQGWKPLKSADTLHNFLYQEDIKPLWWAARYGEQKFKEKFMYQHKTALPTMRDSLWYSDGTKLNYFYQTRDENGRFQMRTTSVYEVMDVYSEALLGYHISDAEDYVAQYSAYRMAIQTSQHKPYQISYDNQGGHKKLETGDFLTKLSHLSIKTKPYNGKSKTIESSFGRFQQQILKKDWFFTGQNIQAKREESKANLEFIMANKHNLPTLEEIHEIYKHRRDEWNNAKHPKSEKSRIELYRESSNPKAVKVELMDMVDLFWVLREKAVTCNAYGISFQEKGVKYDYEVTLPNGMPDIKWLARNIDKKFRIKYDPQDFSMIYLYEETPQGLRFVTEAHEKVTIHRGKQEQETGEMERWAAIDQATAELREEMRETLMEIQRQHNQLPEQHGLVTPGIKGLKKDKKKKVKQPADNFGRLQKAMSNAVMANVEDEEDFNEDNLYNLM